MKFTKTEIEILSKIAVEAGLITLKYHKNLTSFNKKNDGSQVTIADEESNDYICENLNKYFPEIDIISEESSHEENLRIIKNETQYFIIDPLDGTSNFIKGGDNYTINIAFVKDQKAQLGFIYLPKKDILYFTDNEKSYKKIGDKISEIKASSRIKELTLITTKREPEKTNIEEWIKNKSLDIKESLNISSSYKFCLIADGQADIYPRMVNIKSWDIAAGVAIVNLAGGKVIDRKLKNEIIFKSLTAEEFIAFNDKIKV